MDRANKARARGLSKVLTRAAPARHAPPASPMGSLLRLAVLVLAMGALCAGTAFFLARETARQAALERRVEALPSAEADTLREAARAHHLTTRRAIVAVGGLGFVCLLVLGMFPSRPQPPAPPPDAARARTEMRGMESLARTTVAQRAELDQEREARHRSEQDLHLQQVLANHALQDKIRLGRDLHDGVVQMLYAAGLLLETANQRLAAPGADPAPAAALVERAKTTLNAAIREARGAIGELSPDALTEQDFPSAVHALLDHLDAGRLRERRVELAPGLPAFAEPARTHLLQIIRESISNALRHGGASRVEIEFAPRPASAGAEPDALRLIVRDDGAGFDPAAATRGRGLDNLAARARALGAALAIESAPGRGAAIVLDLPAPAASSADEPASA